MISTPKVQTRCCRTVQGRGGGRLHRRGSFIASSERASQKPVGSSFRLLWGGLDQSCLSVASGNKLGGGSGSLQQFHQKVQGGQRPRYDLGTKTSWDGVGSSEPNRGINNGHLAITRVRVPENSVWISKTQQTTQNPGEAPTREADAAGDWDGGIQTMNRAPGNFIGLRAWIWAQVDQE